VRILLLVLRKLRRVLLTVLGVITAAFFIQRLGGKPAALLLPIDASPADVDRLNTALGYDRPILTQYWDFLGDAVRGDFGSSLRRPGVPALEVVMERLPLTVQLALVSFVGGVLLALLLVLIVRLTGGRFLRMAIVWFGQLRLALPTFLFGILLILVFSVQLGWLPSYGSGTWKHLVLPAITLGSFQVAQYVRLMDSSFGQQEDEDYVRTARSKGTGRLTVVLRHMLPNALLPVITVMGIHLGALLGGAVVIESVFNWPGLGQLVIDSVRNRDFPVVVAALLVVSVIFVVVNLIVDLLYSVIDPRVRTP
jgi:peptide/nickel transport system permease protein